MLPRSTASVLLLLGGIWWGLAVVAWITWERWFASPGQREARNRAREEGRDWPSTVADIVQFGLPSALAIGLALDGLVAGVVFYAPGWSLFLPYTDGFQVLGGILLFLGLPLFTAGAYLTGKCVYSKLPEERPLLERGPYRFVRHPSYLSFLLTAIGFLLLAQNAVMLPLLFALTALRYPKPEEEELVHLYGDAYREYRERTGRLLPKFLWRR